jgi:hypothetical protein
MLAAKELPSSAVTESLALIGAIGLYSYEELACLKSSTGQDAAPFPHEEGREPE